MCTFILLHEIILSLSVSLSLTHCMHNVPMCTHLFKLSNFPTTMSNGKVSALLFAVISNRK